jgi:hypothetical protein
VRTLEDHILADFAGAFWRAATGPTADVAIVPTGWPTSWFRGKVLIQVTTEGLLVRRPTPLKAFKSALDVLWKGLGLSIKLGLRGPHVMPLPAAPAFRPALKSEPHLNGVHAEVKPAAAQVA